MNILINAFSLNMLREKETKLKISHVEDDEWENAIYNCKSYIGHKDLANILGVEYNRETVKIIPGDNVYIAQITGARLPEGTTELPSDVNIEHLKVEIIGWMSMVVKTSIITKEDTEHELKEIDVLNPNYTMKEKMKVASEMATVLKDIIEEQGLSVRLKNNKDKYVLVEGWNTLGTMLGVSPVTESVEIFPTNAKYGFKARVSLYLSNGNKLATAEAIATSAGFQKDEFAVYSMAQTRATGKAYRMAFSWIMKLAGYEPTPAEEMPVNKKFIRNTKKESD